MNNNAVLAHLARQAEGAGADFTTVRALVEEASEAGAARALERLGLQDARARRDMDELRELLQAWRDAKKSVTAEVLKWAVRVALAVLVTAMALKAGVVERVF